MSTLRAKIEEVRKRHIAEAEAAAQIEIDELIAGHTTPGDDHLRALLDEYRAAKKRKRPEMVELMERHLIQSVKRERDALREALHDAYDSGRSVSDLKEALGVGNNQKTWAEIWGDKKTRRGPRATTRGWEIVDDEPEMF